MAFNILSILLLLLTGISICFGCFNSSSEMRHRQNRRRRLAHEITCERESFVDGDGDPCGKFWQGFWGARGSFGERGEDNEATVIHKEWLIRTRS